MENLIENLPSNEVVCVHDYSEGYSCHQQDEVSSIVNGGLSALC